MPLARGSFSDLATRLLTGFAVAAVGLAAVWAGYPWFMLLVAAIAGVLVWELARMLGGVERVSLGLGAGGSSLILAAKFLPLWLGLPLLFLIGLAGFGMLQRNRRLFLVLTIFIMLASFGLVTQRDTLGATWMFWLVSVVIVTDVGGYFAGRVVGGPKFWPRVSPKKTWSGTVAGWVAAALVGWAFMSATGTGAEIVGFSVALSMASQMGDIAESAVKRRAGVKDSSALLPGHGGLWDRFDGMLGASLLLLLVQSLTGFPAAVV